MSTLTPQQQFDQTYMSTMEICKEVGVSRSSVTNALKRKFLPEPIVVSDSHTHVWLRDQIKPVLAAWKLVLTARKNNQ